MYFDRPGDCSPEKGDWRFDNLNGSHHQKSSSEVLITLMMTSAQVVETSVTTTDNSPSRNFTHPDDQTTLLQLILTVLRSPYTEFEYQYYSILGSPALAIPIPSCKVLISFTVPDLVDVDLYNRMFNRSCSIRTPILCKYSCAHPQFQWL